MTNNRFRDPNYGEPKFTKELTKVELSQTLNWYTQNRDKKAALKYATDYFKKKLKLSAESTLKKEPSTFGFICRIVTNGGQLSPKDAEWFNGEIARIKEESKKAKPVVVEEVVESTAPNIQDRINEKVHECVGELEGQLDDYILSEFKEMGSAYGVMHTYEIKGVHANKIIKIYQNKKLHYEEVLDSDDKQFKEGYSNFKRMQLKKILGYINSVIDDATKIKTASLKNRKPRARKIK